MVRYNTVSGTTDTIFADPSSPSIYSIRVDDQGRILYRTSVPIVVDGHTGAVLNRDLSRYGAGDYAQSERGSLTLVVRPVANDTFHEISRVDLADMSERPAFRIPAGPRSEPPTLRNLFLNQVDGHRWAIGEVDYYDNHRDRAPTYAFAYDLDADSLVWVRLFPAESQYSNAQRVVADERHVYQKSWNRVVAWDLRTGAEVWRTDIPEMQVGQSPMMVGGGRVYFLADARGTFGLDATTGARMSYDESVEGTCVGIEPYRGKYLVLSMSAATINVFDPVRGVYERGFRSPHHNTTISRQWFVDNFSVDEARGLLTAHDFHGMYVFDLKDWP